jgi:hypothetical protein
VAGRDPLDPLVRVEKIANDVDESGRVPRHVPIIGAMRSAWATCSDEDSPWRARSALVGAD